MVEFKFWDFLDCIKTNTESGQITHITRATAIRIFEIKMSELKKVIVEKYNEIKDLSCLSSDDKWWEINDCECWDRVAKNIVEYKMFFDFEAFIRLGYRL